MATWIFKHKIISILGICFIILIAGIIIYNISTAKVKNGDVIRTEKEPILSRFPNIGNIEKCLWKADIKGTNGRMLAPAPSSYWMKGYVFLNKSDIEKMKKQYKWTEVQNEWTPSFNESILKINSQIKWLYCEDFNNYVKPASYFGKFYVDIENGIIYFEVEK